jgi:hypothetical protein
VISEEPNEVLVKCGIGGKKLTSNVRKLNDQNSTILLGEAFQVFSSIDRH